MVEIKEGEIKHTKNSDFLIITAGHPRKLNQSMDDIEPLNKPIINKICSKTHIINTNATVIMVTNPANKMRKLAEQYFANVITPDDELDMMRYQCYKNWRLVKNAGMSIIEHKGYTNWGVSAVIENMVFRTYG
jgi:malate/lactate dehydrogenase